MKKIKSTVHILLSTKQIISVLLLLCISISVRSQKIISNFRLYTSADGLPSNQLSCLTQDSYGYLWVGTMQGVSRFNGTTFQNFSEFQSSFPSRFCNQILQLNDSLLLIGTASGIVVFNLKNNFFENHRIQDSILQAGSANFTHCMIRLPNHHLLVSSGTYVSLLDGQLKLIKRICKKSPPYYFFNQPIFLTKDSSKLLLAPLAIMDTRSLKVTYSDTYSYLLPKAQESFFTGLIKTDDFGSILFGIWGSGCYYYHGPSKKLTYFLLSKYGGESNTVKNLYKDKNDSSIIWVASGGAGIFKIDLKHLTIENERYQNTTMINPEMDGCMVILDDSEGNRWIGTGGGLLRINSISSAFQSVDMQSYLSGRWKEAVFNNAVGDSLGNLWIGAFGNWVYQAEKNGKLIHHFTNDNSPLGHLCIDIKYYRDKVYVSTEFNGLFYYDIISKTFRHPSFLPPHYANQASGAFIFDNDYCWINYESEVIRVPMKGGSVFTLSEENPNPKHRLPVKADQMVLDHKGDLWMGLSGWRGKLMKWDRKKDTCMEVPVPANGIVQKKIVVRSLFIDHQDNLWIGTFESGIIKREPQTGRFFQYDRLSGLPNLEVLSIVEDKDLNLWVGTSEGLAVMKHGENRFRSYTIYDGLPMYKVLNLCFPFQNEPYRLLIQGRNKLCWADTRKLLPFNPLISTYIERIQVENKIIDKINAHIFPYSQSHFQFEFAGVYLSSGVNNHYQYQLVGLDEHWIDCGSRHFVNYAKISPGTYTFEVRTENIDGLWSAPATYTFTIRPPYWKTTWFVTLCILSGGILIYLIYRYQLSKAIALMNIRNRISRDLHDEVGSTLSSISFLNQMAAMKDKDNKNLQKISENIQTAQNAMSDIIWMINPKNDELDNLTLRFGELAAEMLEPHNIAYRIHVPEDSEHKKIPMDKRREIFMIFKESLNNIVKYAQCSEVEIDITIRQKIFQMKIRDNGKGFDSDFKSSGNGLQNMKSRADILKGEIRIESSLGNGTQIELKAPLSL